MYHAIGNQIFVLTGSKGSESELFLTLHQTDGNPYTLEEQAETLCKFLNKEFS